MTIKTLHITNSYHPSSGGIRTFYHELLNAANRHRRLVRLVVPAAETSMEQVGEFGRIYHIAAPNSPFLDKRYRWLLPHTYAWPYNSTLRQVLASERPDLVEVCDKFWLLYLSGALRRGWIPGVAVPTMVGLSCERLDDNVASYVSDSRALNYICRCYMRWCYVPRFDYHVAVTDYTGDEIKGLLPDRMKGRFVIAPMGVDFDKLSRAPDAVGLRRRLLEQARGNQNTVLLLYAGRLSPEKNLGILPAMMKLLAERKSPDYRLVVVGDGPSHRELRRALDQLAPGQSLFLGQLQQEELVETYHAADVFVHPNPREPFGIAPLEAMAAGMALVAPASGGILTYANSENAWLTEPTPSAFAEAVHGISFEPETRGQKIAKARRTAEQHSWHRVTDSYFQMYDHLHESCSKKAPAGREVSTLVTQPSPEKASIGNR